MPLRGESLDPGTYTARHARAIEVLDAVGASSAGPPVGGTADGAHVAARLAARYGGLGSFAVDVVFGDLWSRPQLSRRDRSMLVLAFLAAQGADEELRLHTAFALGNGLTEAEIEEIILQVAAYSGFPMAMAAIRRVQSVFVQRADGGRIADRAPADAKDDAQRDGDGQKVLARILDRDLGPDPARTLAGLQRTLGDVGTLAYRWAFGEVWCREALSRRDRSLVTVAIIALLSRSEELEVHIPGALNHGATREEVEEVMVQLVVYGGFPRAVEGIRTARRIWDRLDGVTPP